MNNNKISNAVVDVSVTMNEAANRGRAICLDGYEYDGSTYTKYIGIADTDQDDGYVVKVNAIGRVIAESGEAISSKGTLLGLDSSGRVVAITSANCIDTELVIGTNLETASASGKETEVMLVQQSYPSQTADGLTNARVARATYNFDDDGGVVGDIELDADIPDNAIILGGIIDVVANVTFAAGSPAGTLAIKLQSANDILTASAAGSLTAGLVAPTSIDFTATNAFKLTAERTVTVTIANFAATAGKLHVFIYYVIGS